MKRVWPPMIFARRRRRSSISATSSRLARFRYRIWGFYAVGLRAPRRSLLLRAARLSASERANATFLDPDPGTEIGTIAPGSNAVRRLVPAHRRTTVDR